MQSAHGQSHALVQDGVIAHYGFFFAARGTALFVSYASSQTNKDQRYGHSMTSLPQCTEQCCKRYQSQDDHEKCGT